MRRVLDKCAWPHPSPLHIIFILRLELAGEAWAAQSDIQGHPRCSSRANAAESILPSFQSPRASREAAAGNSEALAVVGV